MTGCPDCKSPIPCPDCVKDMEDRFAACLHENTYFDDKGWPTGEVLEICKDCGMSRLHWEQGEYGWRNVQDIEGERKLLQDFMDANNA